MRHFTIRVLAVLLPAAALFSACSNPEAQKLEGLQAHRGRIERALLDAVGHFHDVDHARLPAAVGDELLHALARRGHSQVLEPLHVGDITGYVDYIYYPAESWSRFGVTAE